MTKYQNQIIYVTDSFMNLPIVLVDRYLLKYQYPKLGSGEEGIVYQYNEKTAIKLLIAYNYLDLKWKKIDALAFLYDESFCFPSGLFGFFDEQKKEGYILDLVTKNLKYKNVDELGTNETDLAKKLKILIEADEAIQRIHKKGVILGDVHGENILINEEDHPKFIDTDNYAYGDFSFDLVPWRILWCFEYLKNYLQLSDSDKYWFAYMTLECLIPDLNLPNTMLEHPDFDYLNSLVESLEVNKNVKEGLKVIFSDAHNKPYISPILQEIDPNHPILTEQKIRQLKR